MPAGWSLKAGIPLLGRIAAGTPILAEEDREEDLAHRSGHVRQPGLPGPADTGGFHDRGRNFGRRPGRDRAGEQAEPGTIVAVLVEDMESEATLKRYRNDGRTIRLEAANPDIPDLVFEGEDRNRVKIVGRLRGVIRSLTGRIDVGKT